MKPPIEHDRCIIIGIKMDDKNISTFSEVSSDFAKEAITKWGLST